MAFESIKQLLTEPNGRLAVLPLETESYGTISVSPFFYDASGDRLIVKIVDPGQSDKLVKSFDIASRAEKPLLMILSADGGMELLVPNSEA